LHKLSRDVVTTLDLWRGWTVGLGAFRPISLLDNVYGSGWRPPPERQYNSMRKVIIDEIMSRAGNSFGDQGMTQAVVEAMEQERVGAKATVDKFIKGIKEARKLQC
jgi:Transcriptional activator of glycolytic enzymes